MNNSTPKFPVFGVLDPHNLRDEKVLSFDHVAAVIKVWHKEKVTKTVPYSSVIAAVNDILRRDHFSLYFNDGTLPWSFRCPTQEHCLLLCGYLGQCVDQGRPDLCSSDTDQLYSSTWVEKKGKVKWARRWIALVGCRLLCYRNEGIAPKGRKAPSTVPLNVIPISGNRTCTKFALGPCGTVIVMETFREYQFRFSSKQEATAWLQAMQQAATRQDNISASRTSSLGTRDFSSSFQRGAESKAGHNNSNSNSSNSNNSNSNSNNNNNNNGNGSGSDHLHTSTQAQHSRKKRNSVTPDIPKDASGRHLNLAPNKLRLYTWGSNAKGQLAASKATSQMIATPQQVESLRGKNTPTSVACGYNHMACVTKSGQLFMWGEGKHGQLGLGGRIKQSR